MSVTNPREDFADFLPESVKNDKTGTTQPISKTRLAILLVFVCIVVSEVYS